MKPFSIHHQITARFTALSIALNALVSPVLVAQSGPEQRTEPRAGTANSTSTPGWVPPAPVKSSESHPPQLAAVAEASPNMEFTEEMAASSSALKRSRVLRTPVIRSKKRGTKDTVSNDESAALGRALVGYQKAGGSEAADGRKALEEYLERYPDGDYSPSVALELADAHWRTGSWEKALDFWEKAWARAFQADESDIDTRRMGDVILAELLTHSALLGRKERLRAILKATAGREYGADASNAIRHANELIWFLDNRAEQNIQCGFSAANLH